MEDIENEEIEVEAPESAPIEDLETLDDPDVESESEEYETDDVEQDEPESDEPIYEANHTYKVLDSEFEMDDRLKGFIKNEEDEGYFRDLLERAHGLEKVQGDRQVLRTDNTRLMETENQRQAAVGQLNSFVQNNDLKPFLDTFKVSKNQIIEYASNLLKIEEMEPQERAAYDKNEQDRMQGYDLQQQNQVLQQQNNHLQTQQLATSVDSTLGSPEFSNYVRDYDAQKGAGSFKREIAQLGNAYWHQTQGKVVAPEHLAREFINRSWMGAPPEAAHTPEHQAPARHTKVVVRDRNQPTMPRIRGGGASPIKTYPKSIADLRNIASQKAIGG